MIYYPALILRFLLKKVLGTEDRLIADFVADLCNAAISIYMWSFSIITLLGFIISMQCLSSDKGNISKSGGGLAHETEIIEKDAHGHKPNERIW